jgi:hypothetical protein
LWIGLGEVASAARPDIAPCSPQCTIGLDAVGDEGSKSENKSRADCDPLHDAELTEKSHAKSPLRSFNTLITSRLLCCGLDAVGDEGSQGKNKSRADSNPLHDAELTDESHFEISFEKLH